MPGLWDKLSASSLRRWFVGLLILAGLILLVTHVGELEHFAALLEQAEPAWLLLTLLLQAATYVCVAGVWYLALRRAGESHPLLPLVPLGIAKLFSDQAMPTAGMSGTAFFIAALRQRGVPTRLCMATLLLSLMSYYAAYLLAALASVLLLSSYHAVDAWIMVLLVVFCLVAVGIPASALWLRRVGRRKLPPLLLRVPGLHGLMQAVAHAPGELMHDPALLLASTCLHGAVFVLDAATLWVMLQVVGVETAFGTAFSAFMLASMVTTVGPIPLGLGSFEVTCVGMLHVLGVPLEAALAATLLLRGFTLWLPMLPGMWLTHRALR